MPGAAARERARRWYADPALRAISDPDDAVRAAASRLLAPALLLDRVEADSGRAAGALLDLGCGGGEALASLAATEPDLRLLGVEPDRAAAAAARAALPAADIAVGRAEDLGRGREVDAVLVHLSLGLMAAPGSALARGAARLAPGGALLVVDLARPSRGAPEPDPGRPEGADRAAPSVAEFRADQAAASFTAAGLARLLELAAPPGWGVAVDVGDAAAIFGPDPRRPTRAPGARTAAALAALAAPGPGAVPRDAPGLLYGWITRPPGRAAPEQRSAEGRPSTERG